MNVLIVEDELRIAKRIERMVLEILSDNLKFIKVSNTLKNAVEYIESNTLDLVFLDLNLNGESGFDLLATAVSKSFYTIIVSAYKDQAIKAFEYGVLDFVPKPFNKDRLELAINRMRTEEKIANNPIKFLTVKKRHKIQLIPIDSIVYIKGAGVYSELFLSDGKTELHDKSLEKLERLLLPSFERVHKSYLVKMTEIKEIIVASGSKYMAELTDGTQIPIGRTKYKDLKAKWI
ncbi:DNA-binding response regulator, LytR/AlgR family [Tenacibaculum sp. MAR_2009_124]|uniref:LytR/AlgR family response regulator transcription factor n=1 Tax=Tenacibaculum sp. MAR_2009_124 TaxID=1250059 RepID=UPI000897858B|nr:LytTR family DNA-binding domain-containing protein [Tenacibaculum sp. MAR_2009_124]SEB46679.1 DNA-binding response regulator, LytR/AlgR family [Tenacibaculum sp. MAR_2009_124]